MENERTQVQNARAVRSFGTRRQNADGSRIPAKRRVARHALGTDERAALTAQPAEPLTFVGVADPDAPIPERSALTLATHARPDLRGWRADLPWAVKRVAAPSRRAANAVARVARDLVLNRPDVDWHAAQALFGSNTAKMESQR